MSRRNIPLLEATGRVYLVTGAAGGLGRALLPVLRAGGAKIAACHVGPRETKETDADIRWFRMDARDEADVKATVQSVLDHYGRLDGVLHLGGIVGHGPLTEVSLEQWNNLLAVNLTSAFLLARETHGALKASKGSLILLSSTNGLNGGSALSGPAYAVAKAGLINLTRYLAKEWMADGIRVNCVAPGPVATPMLDRLSDNTIVSLQDMSLNGSFATADQVAALIAFLCSDHAGQTTGTVNNISAGLFLD
ncbi:SDR family NAD(P)-dependent oxidoreductase [Govanella unica]|uniref:SDR family oxidoreductase n=1 Tax=Govanella unica TaxID=2975056 RepID=A0A9X3Z6B5_9PROT|nr:SDR family NAD(P)-dependent oxidoreductase [Govania unica]MDA5192902.1 SDR family oxidoreductase [Govania unica]